MIHHYLFVAFRNIWRQKGQAVIHLSSLSIGMACTILILLWIHDELSYDKFHGNYNELYRVVVKDESPAGISHMAITPAPLACVLHEDFPEIEEVTRVYRMSNCIFKYNDQAFQAICMFVDPSFLSMFSFPLIAGVPSRVLTEPHSVVLTKETSEEIFGQDDPIGRNLHIQNCMDVTITGILSTIPSQSHLQFDMLLPMTLAPALDIPLDTWGNYEHFTYVRLKKDTHAGDVNKKIMNTIEEHSPGAELVPYLQALSSIHLNPKFQYDLDGHGDIRIVRIYMVIAFFILLIACMNYVSLSTANSSCRSKEIGLRKVVGALRKHIFHQFIDVGKLVFPSVKYKLRGSPINPNDKYLLFSHYT